jgi:protein arginine kinase
MFTGGCEWLRSEGDDNDIVISSRIRLARNVAGFPFQTRASEQDRKAVCAAVAAAAAEVFDKKKYCCAAVDAFDELERAYLVERQLISRELSQSPGTRSALIDKKEQFCVMVNEEDHLRLCAMTGGFAPYKVWKRINDIDNKLESKLDYVFHRKYGYLTACPTNTGTGMRVSVMLHLPALVISKEIDKVFRSLQKVNLAVRGLYGEGTQPAGDFFQISNQQTLGKTEEELLEKISTMVPQIVNYERQAREYLLKERKEFLFDRCGRAEGLLKTARTIGTAETMHHLSSIRLGVNMKILDGIPLTVVNELFLNTQPAHLQKIQGKELTSSERDVVRADYIRRALSEV